MDLLLQIREELRANGIDVYPQKEFDEDAEDRMINDKIRVRIMFWGCGVVGTRSWPQLPAARSCLTHGVTVGLNCAVGQEVIPFAVVGSDQEYQVNGRRLLGRKTKWGTIEGKRWCILLRGTFPCLFCLKHNNPPPDDTFQLLGSP